jgi:hypothetical protein
MEPENRNPGYIKINRKPDGGPGYWEDTLEAIESGFFEQ